MSRRYTDRLSEHKVDFIARKYDVTFLLGQVLLLLFFAWTVVFVWLAQVQFVYFLSISFALYVLIACFFHYRMIKWKCVVSSSEFQNAVFANALTYDAEFCMIVRSDGSTFYADPRFQYRFARYKYEVSLAELLKIGNVPEEERNKVMSALMDKRPVKVYITLRDEFSKRNNDLLLSFDQVPINAKVIIDGSAQKIFSMVALAKPRDYFIIKAKKIDKERLYEALIMKHNIGMYVTTPIGYISYANNAFLDIMEVDSVSRGMNLSDFLAPPNVIDEQLKENETLFRTATGIYIKANVTQAVFCDQYNNLKTYGLLTPVKFNVEDYDNHPCFTHASLPILQCTDAGKVVRANKSMLALANETRGDQVESIYDFICEEDQDKVSKCLSDRKLQSVSFEVILWSGQHFIVYFDKFLSNQNVYVIGYFIDVSGHKKLQLQLERSQKMQAVGQLAGGIAHDFNNILTAISGFCDLLLNRECDASIVDDVVQIKQNVTRAAALTSQLLAFSRQQTLPLKVLDVNNVIAELMQMITRLIGENIRVAVNYEKDVQLIKADRGKLEQVLINLVVNAKLAMLKGGALTITTKNITTEPGSAPPFGAGAYSPDGEGMGSGDYVAVLVQDTGHGITREIMSKIFDPFFSTRDPGRGTGLGLSTVYGIVKQFGGFVYVESVPDVGSTFSVFFPRVFVNSVHDQEGEVQDCMDEFVHDSEVSVDSDCALGVRDFLGKLSGNLNIFLIEDEESVRVFASRALTKYGYNVISAGSGDEALELLRGDARPKYVDLIVSDVIMPGVSGPEVVEQVLKVYPGARVLFISGYPDDVLVRCDSGGRVSYDMQILLKPFTMKQLTGRVREVLRV